MSDLRIFIRIYLLHELCLWV